MAEIKLPKELSRAEIESVKFRWTIKNYSSYMKKEVGFSIFSPDFFYQTETGSKTKWYMQIYPNGDDKEYENHLSVYFYSGEYNSRGLETTHRLSILNRAGEKVYGKLTKGIVDRKDVGYGFSNFIKSTTLQRKASELLPKDALTLCCKVTHSIGGSSEDLKFKEVPECRLGDDLSDLLDAGLFSDAILKARGERFKVHRNILASRSSVFAAMFQCEMKEKNQRVVEIVDMDKEVLREMLNFIYSGEAPDEKSPQLTIDLFKAADKYDLERLKRMCEKDLCKQLSIENASNLLITADLHNADELKATAMEFVNKEISAVMKTKSWKWLVQHHPRFLNEVLEYRIRYEQMAETMQSEVSSRTRHFRLMLMFMNDRRLTASINHRHI